MVKYNSTSKFDFLTTWQYWERRCPHSRAAQAASPNRRSTGRDARWRCRAAGRRSWRGRWGGAPRGATCSTEGCRGTRRDLLGLFVQRGIGRSHVGTSLVTRISRDLTAKYIQSASVCRTILPVQISTASQRDQKLVQKMSWTENEFSEIVSIVFIVLVTLIPILSRLRPHCAQLPRCCQPGQSTSRVPWARHSKSSPFQLGSRRPHRWSSWRT